MGFACNFSSDNSTFSHVSPWASQVVLVVKNLPAKEIECWIPGLGSSRAEDDNLLQYSCLENP